MSKELWKTYSRIGVLVVAGLSGLAGSIGFAISGLAVYLILTEIDNAGA